MATAITMIRMNVETHPVLRELPTEQRVSILQVTRRAVDAYQREQGIASAAAGYVALGANPPAWQDYQAELASLESTLADGLDDIYEDHRIASPDRPQTPGTE